MSQMTQVEAVSVNNNFVTIQTSINARMYQTQASMAQQDPNQNPDVLRVKALDHAKEELYQLRCQSIGLDLANQEWMTYCAWQQQHQNNDLLHAQNASNG